MFGEKKYEHLSRYTWTGPNNKHARLDYFLTSSDLVNYIDKTDIGIRYKSDHNPVSITLKFVEQERGRGNWKFNNNLLGDIDVYQCLHTQKESTTCEDVCLMKINF